MPKILPNDPLLSGFDAASTALNLPALFGPEWGANGTVPGFAKNAYAKANYDQWSAITGRVIGGIGMREGVPEWNIAGFGRFFQKLPTVTPSDVATMAIRGTAKVVSYALAEASTSVPILGWVVELGLGAYEAIKAAIEWNKKAPRPPGEAVEFDVSGNESFAQLLLSMSADADWTDIFRPPSTSGVWSARRVAWNPGGAGEGWAFGTRNDLGRGIIPGLAECVGTLEANDFFVNYQFPDRSPSPLFGAEYDIPPLATTGALRPSSRQMAMLLWETVMKPSVQMFRIDPYSLVTQWHDYYMGLAEFAETLKTDKGVENAGFLEVSRGKNPKTPYNEAAIATTFLSFVAQPDGSVRFLTPDNVPKYDTSVQIATAPKGVSLDRLVEVIGADLTYTYADLVKYVAKLHIDRSMAALSTLVCAYVPEDAALLRASGAHKEKWHEMRARLLNHDAVERVELDLIPDDEYRAAVSQAQHTRRIVADVPLAAGGGKSGKRYIGKPGQAPTVDGAPAPDMPDSPGPGMPKRAHGGGGGGGYLGPAVGVLALGVAGALLVRKLRR